MSSSSKSWSPKWDDAAATSFDQSTAVSLSEQLELDNRAADSSFSFSRLEREFRQGRLSASQASSEIQAFLLKSNQHRSFELMQQIKTFTARLPEGRSIYAHVSNILDKRRLAKERRKTLKTTYYG